MKRLVSIFLIVAFCLVPLTAAAATDAPVITMQPQSPSYPEYSVAIYTVKATGTNLSATWYIEYEGKTYNASQIGGAMQPWEAYAGEAYGAKKLDDNTFTFIFEGIGAELNGAEIWCVIEDGHYDVASTVAYITVGNYASPPEILEIPSSITVAQGETAEIRCVAKSTDKSQLSFLWYVTDSGLLPDIRAIDRGAETADYMLCNTEQPGTHYYVCGITTSAGGTAYSSPVEVTVTKKAAQKPVTEPTEATEATQPTTAEEETTPATTLPASTTPAPTTPAAATPAQKDSGTPWWVLVLVGVGAAVVGAGITLLAKKKK